MTVQDVFRQLHPISRSISRLLRDTGFDPEEGLGDNVCHLPDACEDAFLRDRAEEILEGLGDIHEMLCYLEEPSHGEHVLSRFPNGRYGYWDEAQEAVRTFTCGERLEAKIRDRHGAWRWAMSTVEHDGMDYYLTGFYGTPMDGLTVRERRRPA